MYIWKYTGELGQLICTNAGATIATGFIRIVHGGRGAYVEFAPAQMLPVALGKAEGQAWRFFSHQAYYIEYRAPDGIKVYLQRRPVDYADYRPSFFYISPVSLRDFQRTDQRYRMAEV